MNKIKSKKLISQIISVSRDEFRKRYPAVKLTETEVYPCGHWISVKERLPEKNGRYLVHVPQSNWTGVSSLREGVFDDSLATHWMPLPEPPNE